jgi:uncharacterized protein (TIGR01777 family)
MTKVLISGGTGLVGSHLTDLLLSKGYEINILSRSRSGNEKGIRYFQWSPIDGTIDEEALQADHIIHLAGAGVADKRWTSSRKREIRNSRVLSTELLTNSLQRTGLRPKSIVSASAVGYYGNREDEILSETSTPGTGFLADVCKEWETCTGKLGARAEASAILRIGIVLSTKGGALPQLTLPVNAYIGAYLGTGRQYYPWIHIEDLCNMFVYAMEKPLNGIYNAGAPQPETNKNITKTIAHVLQKPFIPVPAPVFALKLAMGEMAQMVLNSQRTSAGKIQEAGFKFNYPQLDSALKDIFRRKI